MYKKMVVLTLIPVLMVLSCENYYKDFLKEILNQESVFVETRYDPNFLCAEELNKVILNYFSRYDIKAVIGTPKDDQYFISIDMDLQFDYAMVRQMQEEYCILESVISLKNGVKTKKKEKINFKMKFIDYQYNAQVNEFNSLRSMVNPLDTNSFFRTPEYQENVHRKFSREIVDSGDWFKKLDTLLHNTRKPFYDENQISISGSIYIPEVYNPQSELLEKGKNGIKYLEWSKDGRCAIIYESLDFDLERKIIFRIYENNISDWMFYNTEYEFDKNINSINMRLNENGFTKKIESWNTLKEVELSPFPILYQGHEYTAEFERFTAYNKKTDSFDYRDMEYLIKDGSTIAKTVYENYGSISAMHTNMNESKSFLNNGIIIAGYSMSPTGDVFVYMRKRCIFSEADNGAVKTSLTPFFCVFDF